MDSAFDICLRSMNDGHFGIGGIATVEYHFDRTSVAVIGTLTWTWDRDRFELAVPLERSADAVAPQIVHFSGQR